MWHVRLSITKISMFFPTQITCRIQHRIKLWCKVFLFSKSFEPRGLNHCPLLDTGFYYFIVVVILVSWLRLHVIQIFKLDIFFWTWETRMTWNWHLNAPRGVRVSSFRNVVYGTLPTAHWMDLHPYVQWRH